MWWCDSTTPISGVKFLGFFWSTELPILALFIGINFMTGMLAKIVAHYILLRAKGGRLGRKDRVNMYER